MPEIMRTSDDLQTIFKRNADTAGLDVDVMPAAVKLALGAVLGHSGQFEDLLNDLPSDARAYDWLSAMWKAYAEWCDHTIVVDNASAAPAPVAEPSDETKPEA